MARMSEKWQFQFLSSQPMHSFTNVCSAAIWFYFRLNFLQFQQSFLFTKKSGFTGSWLQVYFWAQLHFNSSSFSESDFERSTNTNSMAKSHTIRSRTQPLEPGCYIFHIQHTKWTLPFVCYNRWVIHIARGHCDSFWKWEHKIQNITQCNNTQSLLKFKFQQQLQHSHFQKPLCFFLQRFLHKLVVIFTSDQALFGTNHCFPKLV